MYLLFDTETTGFPPDCRLVQISLLVCDDSGETVAHYTSIVRPDGFSIPDRVVEIHGISTQIAYKHGRPLSEILAKAEELYRRFEPKFVVCHNIRFDVEVLSLELNRLGKDNPYTRMIPVCTMAASKKHSKPGKLQLLHQALFGEQFEKAHDASADVLATKRCFFELKRLGVIDTQALLLERENSMKV